MPPDIDIYILTKFRNKEMIESFVDLYVDRDASGDREDEELMILPLNSSDEHLKLDDYEWEPALSLSNIINRGLSYPRRSFTVYLEPEDKDLDRAILSFTSDDQLILGLSIDDEVESDENVKLAQTLLVQLLEQFNGKAGLIMCEKPPPTSETEFMRWKSGDYTENVIMPDVKE